MLMSMIFSFIVLVNALALILIGFIKLMCFLDSAIHFKYELRVFIMVNAAILCALAMGYAVYLFVIFSVISIH